MENTEIKIGMWNQMIEGFANEPDIVKCNTKEEVYKEIEEYLCNRYDSSPIEKIKEIAESIAEDIMKKREGELPLT